MQGASTKNNADPRMAEMRRIPGFILALRLVGVASEKWVDVTLPCGRGSERVRPQGSRLTLYHRTSWGRDTFSFVCCGWQVSDSVERKP